MSPGQDDCGIGREMPTVGCIIQISGRRFKGMADRDSSEEQPEYTAGR